MKAVAATGRQLQRRSIKVQSHSLHTRPQFGPNVRSRRRFYSVKSGEYRTSSLPEHDHHGPQRTEPIRPDRAYIALGSNVGSRISHISNACDKLTAAGISITRTSNLYETAPMYVTDQAAFINGVCEVVLPTHVSCPSLLHKLKGIESQLGRSKGAVDKGPRNIDLDLLLAGAQEYQSPGPQEHQSGAAELDLTVPHADMLEREFVLRPLADLIPHSAHPSFPGLTYARRLALLSAQNPQRMPSLSSPTARLAPLRPTHPTRKTQIMAILNLTPDSFSDGGRHNPTDPSAILAAARAMHAAGATMLDIGGQSTAPRAPEVPAHEELARVLPAIRAIRSDPTLDAVAVSIDTYRASVARAAVGAGADVVNDVSAGALDPEMLPAVAELGCGVVLSHMRGTPETMLGLTDYAGYGGVVAGVAAELGARVDAAVAAGVRRWKMVLDPGIGFAKTADQNCEILRRLGELKNAEGLTGFPWLLGSSRKGFVGKATGVESPEKRGWGTAATVAAAVQGGADFVRVHDVDEMRQVVYMADAIWRV